MKETLKLTKLIEYVLRNIAENVLLSQKPKPLYINA